MLNTTHNRHANYPALAKIKAGALAIWIAALLAGSITCAHTCLHFIHRDAARIEAAGR